MNESINSSLDDILKKKAKSDNSSYTKVYIHLMETDDGRRLWDRCEKAYNEIIVGPVHFVVNSPTDVKIQYAVKGVNRDRVDRADIFRDADDLWILNGSSMFNASDVEDVLVRNMVPRHMAADYKKIPTYGCDVARMLGAASYKRRVDDYLNLKRERRIDASDAVKFKDWFFDLLNQSNSRKPAWSRLQAEVRKFESTIEFEHLKERAILDKAMTEIGDVMRKYTSLGDEVLKRAISEYVASDVLDL